MANRDKATNQMEDFKRSQGVSNIIIIVYEDKSVESESWTDEWSVLSYNILKYLCMVFACK